MAGAGAEADGKCVLRAPLRESQLTVPETPSPEAVSTLKDDARLRRRDVGMELSHC